MTTAPDTQIRDYFAAAERYLSAIDQDWASLIARIGPCALQQKLEREPYEALVRAVAHQQLHGKAAEAILNRLLQLFPDALFPSPEQLLATDDAQLRACGFSLGKLTSIRDIAQKALDGVVPDREAAQSLSDEELIARLVTLRGVGRWTVEMLLMFTLDRRDILPVDDFGVREGWKVLKALERQPTPKELAALGLAWSPYRSAAAWYLWQAAGEAKQLASQGRAAKPKAELKKPKVE